MKRFLKLGAIGIVVAGVVTGAYLHFAARPAAASSASLTTATVQMGTLQATVSSAGNITAAQEVTLNFQQSGTVQKVNVKVGDQVKAGQVLAELDTADLQLQLQNAQVSLKLAQDKLAQAQTPATTQSIANARAQLEAAQAAVTSAQAAYTAAVQAAAGPNSQLEAARAQLEKTTATLQQAQAAYDKVSWRPDVGKLPQAATLQSATADYNSAKASYDALVATSGTDASSKVQQAQSQLQQARSQATQAQNALDTLLQGPDATAVSIAQDQVNQAQIALEQAQLKLQQAQIAAPFDGMVTVINITASQGAPTGSGGAIQLADLSHLQVVVNMAEVDVNRVKVGQDAQITLDALPNVTLGGKVSQVAPAGVTQQGVVNYPVTIQLTNPSQSVRSGMTANLNVIVLQKDNVLMVPNRAVKTAASSTPATAASSTASAGTASGVQGNNQSSGANGAANAAARRSTRQQVVTVLKDGQQVQVAVQTGVSNDTMTEIVSGLAEGDVVVLNTTTTAQVRTGGGLGIPGVGSLGR